MRLTLLLILFGTRVYSQQQPSETCESLDTLIGGRHTGLAEECSTNTFCTEVNCTTIVDVDQNENPRNQATYIVTFNPCEMPFTVRYQNIIEMVGSLPVTEVDIVTNISTTQTFGGDSTVDLVVIPTNNGITFGASITTPEQTTPLQLFANTEIPLQCIVDTTTQTTPAASATNATTTDDDNNGATSLQAPSTTLAFAAFMIATAHL